MPFAYYSPQTNLFRSVDRCWDARTSLSERDQIFKIGGTFAYGDSFFEFTFCPSEVLRLNAILHDKAGAMH